MQSNNKSIQPRAKVIYDVQVTAWRVDYLEPRLGGYREWSE
jgi:hypothetical protein